MADKQVIDHAALLEVKADELVSLLQTGTIDARRVKAIQQKLVSALDEASLPAKLQAFERVDTSQDRLELLNDFEALLSQHQLDSEVTKRYLTREHFKKSIVVMIGILMITLGMCMIIMPAPPYFEMFTVFYFNPNDGVTIMDLLSLLIVFTGVYLFMSAVLKKQGT